MSDLTTRFHKGTPLTNTEVDANFQNLNTDKYQSGDDITVTDITVSGRFIVGVDASVTANGSTQAQATQLTKTYNIINTAASANLGVQLLDASAGTRVTIFNSTNNTVKIYPYSGESINDLATNAALQLGPEKGRDFVAISATQWQSTDEGDAAVVTSLNASGLASLDGGIDVDSAFTVADTTGNVSTLGTLDVSGLASLDGGIDVDGAFTVANSTGDIATTGDLTVGGSTTLSGDLKYGSGNVVPSGTTQADATQISETTTLIVSNTGTTGQKGVKLPAVSKGLRCEIFNPTANALKVYPNTSDSIEGSASNAPKNLPANTSLSLVGRDSSRWEVLRPIAVYDASDNLLN